MPRKILIVDDNITNRMLLRRILEADYILEEAENGKEAVRLLEQDQHAYSAILLDIIMPEMNGFQVLEWMRNTGTLSQIPVIVATSSTDNETEMHALNLGATDFIAKPYNHGIIRQRVKNLVKLRESAALINAMQRDKLTGLWNRDAFFEKAEKAISNAPEGYFFLSCIDIDKFKVINDRFGAERGDEVLRGLAKVISEDCEANGGLCGHISADNFVTLFPRELMLSSDAERRRRENAMIDSLGIPFTLSFGRYVVADKSLTVESMYNRAKLALSSVKGRFDLHVAIYDESMRSDLLREQKIIREMKNALETGQFEPWYQPQYNHSAGTLIGSEALARWRHPERGIIPPGEFINVFERNGFIYELDKSIWEQVCSRLRVWLDDGLEPLPVSVNISRYDLLRDDLSDVIVSLTDKYAIPVGLLRLEVTESAFANSTAQVVSVVKRLIEHGFTVEIDDFGSGYSSLNTLKDVPAQILKLDMRFMDNSDDSGRGGNILESIVRMAKWIGMSVIAEGVEKSTQADYLKSIGCCYVQGYLYSPPIPAGEFEALLSRTDKEERLATLETVESLDNNSFWNPESTDTLIFNSYVGAACIFEYHNGRMELIRVTDKYTQVIGNAQLSVDEALKLDVNAHLDEDNRRLVDEAVRRSLEEKDEVTSEYVFTGLPGCPEKTYLRSTLRVIATAGERCLVYCTNDNITAQRQAEQRTLEVASNERKVSELLHAVVENIDGGISATTVSEDGARHYLFNNERFFTMFGYTPEQFKAELPNGPLDTVHPDDAEKARLLARGSENANGTFTAEFRVYRRQGGIMWVRVCGSVCRLTGIDLPVRVIVIYDISQERATLENLRESEERFRIASDMSGVLIGRYDIRTQEYVHNDKTMFSMGFGSIISNVPQSYIDSGTVAPESEQTLIDLYKRIRAGETPCHGEARLMLSDGMFHWCRIDANVIFDEDGAPSQAIVVTTNISEQREKEAVYIRWQQSIDEKTPESYTLFRWNLTRDSAIDSYEGRLLEMEFDPTLVRDFNENTLAYSCTHVHPDDRKDYVAKLNSDTLLAAYQRGTRTMAHEYREIIDKGEWRWLRITIEMVEYPNSTEVEAYLLYENIDDIKKEELLIREKAELDPLTGVLNRATFAIKAEQLKYETVPGMQCALLMMDIDGFKLLNDTFGHAAGDQALIEMANTLNSILRPSDLLGRLGGDEFLVALRDMSSDFDIENKARQICSSLRRSYGDQVITSVSIGIAVCPHDGSDYETIYRKADAALYAVKDSGKDSFAFYQPGMDERHSLRSAVTVQEAPERPRERVKRRMLIADKSKQSAQALADVFKDEFVIETVCDASNALMRLRHYGTAVSIMLLDPTIPGLDGYAILGRMRASEQLRSIPVIVVSSENEHETALRAIRSGAADFVAKPIDTDIIRVRVHSAISKAENERLRAQNSLLSVQNAEVEMYRTALESAGIAVISHDWQNGTFTYSPQVSEHIAGVFDRRRLWRILLSDFVADAASVKNMQTLVHNVANNRERMSGTITVPLKTPSGEKHDFCMNVIKLLNEFKLTSRLIITFTDLNSQT